MKPGLKQENGFTLIEILAAIVILAIVSLVLTSYFTNAMSYSKSNQNKTIMVNLARNALFYVEKQDFEKMKDYFITKGKDSIEATACQNDTVCSSYETLVTNTETLSQVLNPSINGVDYQINIRYQRDLHQPMLTSADQEKKKMASYLLPVSISVREANASSGPQSEPVVEGYITDEKIR